MELIYTDPKKILSALGLSQDDIEETYFSDSDLGRELSTHLFSWLPNHQTLVVEIGNLANTPAQEYVFNCLILYSTYFCSSRIAAAKLIHMRSRTDGTNAYARPNVDYDALEKAMLDKANSYQQKILTELASPDVAVNIQQATFVAPASDPVTG